MKTFNFFAIATFWVFTILMIAGYSGVQKDKDEKFLTQECNTYKASLKTWKKDHGKEWLEKLKLNLPRDYEDKKEVLDKGLDYAFPE